mgnify:CR=1 FL=1
MPFDDAVRHADVEDFHVAAQAASRHQAMAGFRRHEGDGLLCLESRSERKTAQAAHATRQVDGHDSDAGRCEPFNDIRYDRRNRARQPGTEQRIDDDVAPLRPVGLDGRRGGRACRPGPGCVALQGGRIPEVKDRDLGAAVHQGARGNITVAAIVARPAEHDEPTGFGEMPQRRSGHRLPCPFHQAEGIDAGGCRGGIAGAHLGWRQEKMLDRNAHSSSLERNPAERNIEAGDDFGVILCICLFCVPITRGCGCPIWMAML